MPCKKVVSWNAMVAIYVQDLQIDEAVKLFKGMPYEDCVSWTTIVNGYIRVKQENSGNSYAYGHGNEELNSCVTSFKTNMLYFSNSNNTNLRYPPPDLFATTLHLVGQIKKREELEFIKLQLNQLQRRGVDFNIYSGTSMTCPHVSGITALIMSIHPDWSPTAIRSALITTAYSAYNDDKKPATPFDFGAEHVDLQALRPGLVYDLTVDDYLSFLCALNYSAANMETVVQRKYSYDIKKHHTIKNLNYPSFAVVFEERMEVVKHRRTLTNVGAAGTYKISVHSLNH
ncbi:hypothetical protein KIW84_074480 [Lathyrus oleraceus]|uniref:Uncharacterized protein n=1 Tax=Pisum sativum TaxID=3888 RepID=A0A9D4VU07_PEA|nr:hypothetical protein KIW84_074480 [Pisum sativum]